MTRCGQAQGDEGISLVTTQAAVDVVAYMIYFCVCVNRRRSIRFCFDSASSVKLQVRSEGLWLPAQ